MILIIQLYLHGFQNILTFLIIYINFEMNIVQFNGGCREKKKIPFFRTKGRARIHPFGIRTRLS